MVGAPENEQNSKNRLLSVVVPVFNENKTIMRLINEVRIIDEVYEIILVDDCSTDGTKEIIQQIERENINNLQYPLITCLYHKVNRGKAAALKTGFKSASASIIVIQDADLEYSPKDYKILLRLITDSNYNIVYGSRFAGPHSIGILRSYIANKFLTFFTNILSQIHITDMETGYKMFKKDILKNITIKSKRFGIEPELTIKFAKLGCRIGEVPVVYTPRGYNEGKKIGVKDAIEAVWCIIKYRLFD